MRPKTPCLEVLPRFAGSSATCNKVHMVGNSAKIVFEIRLHLVASRLHPLRLTWDYLGLLFGGVDDERNPNQIGV